MILTNIKDCANCINSTVYGSSDDLTVSCNSNDYVHKNLFNKDGRYCASSCSGFTEQGKIRGGHIAQDKALQFILAGKCEFILHSTKTGADFKFEMTKQEQRDNKDKFIYFLNVLHGYEKTYAGVVWFNEDTQEFKFSQGKKGQINANELNIRSLIFVLNKLFRNEAVQYLDVFHVGKCGACGKKLTTPESILTGLGPTCSKKAGIPRVKVN